MVLSRFSTPANSRGQALIQAIISMGIMSIVCIVFMTMMSNQNRETQALTEKLASLELQQQLTKSMADGTVCKSLLNGLVFDSTQAVPGSSNKPHLNLSQTSIPMSGAPSSAPLVTAGEIATPLSNTLVIDPTGPFRVTDIVGTSSGGVGLFTGYLQVNFDQNRLIRPIKPVRTMIWMETTASGSTQTITDCSGGGLGSSIIRVTATSSWVLNVNGIYYATATATCPTAYVATGGGAHCDVDTAYASLIYSNPTLSGTGYYASCANFGPGAAGTSSSGYGIKTFVVCAPK